MSNPGQPIDPVMALAAQQQPAAQPYYPAGDSRNGPAAATIAPPADPVEALAAGHSVQASQSPTPQSQGSGGLSDPSGYASSIIRNAANAATFNLADPAAAAVGALFPVQGYTSTKPTYGERYDELLKLSRGETAEGQKAHPYVSLASSVAGGVLNPANAAIGAPATLGKALIQGSVMGGAYGAGGAIGNSKDLSDAANQTAVGAGLGAAGGGLGYGLGAAIGKGASSIYDTITGNSQSKGQRLAAALLMNNMGKQGIDVPEIESALGSTQKPLTIMDIGGENSPIQRLGRTVVTLPGEGGQQVTSFLNARQQGQRGRILSDIGHIVPDTDTYGNRASLTQERSVNSNPLYQQAFASAGVGPVDYEAARNELISATSSKAGIAKKIKTIERDNPGALAARGAAGSDTRQNYMDLHDQMQSAESARQAAASKFENVQAGLSAMESNQPLTDARLADFMKDPDIQRGMQTGLNIQRRLSLANGEEFDPNAYAITHYNEAGQPVVGPVPTWKTLHAGRMGLDNMIYSQADPITGRLPQTQEMNSLQQLRSAYSSHLHDLNPELVAADAAWSTPSQKMDAIRLGQKLLNADPEQITQAKSRMNAETAPFYEMGAGRSLRDVANDSKDTANIAKRLMGDQTSRDQISAAFGLNSASSLGSNLSAENAMANTRQFVTGNSSTANKAADIADANKPSFIASLVGDAIKGGLTGGIHGALTLPALNIASRTGSGLISRLANNESRNLELAKILTGTGTKGIEDLNALLSPSKGRIAITNSGKRLGAALGVRGISPVGAYLLSSKPDGH